MRPSCHIYIWLSLWLMAVLALPACERATDLRPEGHGTVVVECVLTQEDRQTLRLSLTDPASAEDRERLKQARVQVFDETEGTLAGIFTYAGRDTWEADLAGLPGHSYRLEITVEGYNAVSARTTMPELPHIKAVIKKPVKVTETADEAFPDNEAGIRFQTSSLPQGPVWIKRMDRDPASGDLIHTRDIATSILNVDFFNLTGATFRFSNIGPGDEPLGAPSPSGPALRIAYYLYVHGQPVHSLFLRIPPVWEGGERETNDPDGYFSIAGADFQSDYDWQGLKEEKERGYLLFMSVSDEYDRYLKELLIEQNNREQSEEAFASLYKHENMFSNIDGGTGIFGSFSQARSSWNFNQFVDAPLHQLETP